jgi:SAM-dependent methyltransferase
MTNTPLAAERGVPSLLWRDGQERRLQMVARYARLKGAVVLIDGCGIGMYASEIRRRFTSTVEAFDIEIVRVQQARINTPHTLVAAAEYIPYPANTFDTILSHEVLEHVADDRAAIQEMTRVLKPGGRIVIFAPNRWYPFETHGHFWRGEYHFGNTPLINYLPDTLRNRLAPHVRAYSGHRIKSLFAGLPVQVAHYRRIYGGYDNIIARLGAPARKLRDILYRLEGTPLDIFGLSHLLVVEKTT